MDIQLLTVILLFCIALFFIGRKVFGQMRHKAKANCDGCGAADLSATKNLKKRA